jgi:hypothetical protein
MTGPYGFDKINESLRKLSQAEEAPQPGGRSHQEQLHQTEVDQDQLAMGVKIEQEHTSDPEKAKVIALDHLAEIPDYYTRLKAMEDAAKAENKTAGAILERIAR